MTDIPYRMLGSLVFVDDGRAHNIDRELVGYFVSSQPVPSAQLSTRFDFVADKVECYDADFDDGFDADFESVESRDLELLSPCAVDLLRMLLALSPF